MKTKILIVIFISLFSINANAGYIKGLGANSCGKVINTINEGRKINVEIETESELTLGMTVADWWRVTDREANAFFIGDLDANKFFSLLTNRLGKLPLNGIS